MTETTAAPRGPRLSDPAVAIVAVAATRLAVFAAATLWGRFLHYRGHHAFVERGLGGFMLLWSHRDAVWFAAIAQHGYGVRPDAPAFFPFYPLLIRAAAVIVADKYYVAGMIVSLAAYCAAMWVLYKLTAELADTRVAAIAVVLISVYPLSFIFSAPYSESLFLLLSASCLWLAQSRRWALAGLLGLLATLTRGSGVVLIVPLVLLYTHDRGWTWRRVRPEWPRDLRLGWALLVPCGLLLYMAYLWQRFGDPFVYSAAEQRHWRRALGGPWTDVWHGLADSAQALRTVAYNHGDFIHGLLPGQRIELLLVPTVLPLLALVFAIACIVFGWRRLPAAYTSFAVLALLFPLLFPSRLYPMWSLPRFVLVIFPLFIALGMVTRDRPVVRWVLIGVSCALLLWLTGAWAINTNAV
jgi:hypothetical protein